MPWLTADLVVLYDSGERLRFLAASNHYLGPAITTRD